MKCKLNEGLSKQGNGVRVVLREKGKKDRDRLKF